VADNQERKNIWASIAITSELKKMGHKVRFVIVTRINSQVGYRLRDLATEYDISKEFMEIERGISQEELRKLYVSSDLFLSTTKAEGLGIPVLEAMACNLLVAGTDTGAIHELLDDRRGYLLPIEYTFRDVWGNSKRDMVDIDKSATIIDAIIKTKEVAPPQTHKYVLERVFAIPIEQMDKVIQELLPDEK
jgi:glycosyltransferase involved in cell wall biosynthesis